MILKTQSIVSMCTRGIYMFFARYLPESNSKINIGQKRLRRWCAKHFAVSISDSANIEKGAVFSRRVYVGKESGIGINARIQGEVHIGDYVMMGPECNIWTINHETSRTDIPMCKQGSRAERPVYIGNDVWIASRVTILPGIKIGNGAIIGAGSIVSKDVPDYAVVAGNPACIVRYRIQDK